MTAIIIINWNGADDTLACLKSLDRSDGSFFVVVADNGSTDDSLVQIEKAVGNLSIKVHVIPLERNWGFAVGNNKAIAYASQYAPDSYMLLNNDTEVEPDFLVRIDEYRKEHPETRILGPLVKYWYDRDRIWSCGGILTFGSRKNIYRDCKVSDINISSPLPVSFISGCALYADASLVNDDGQLLTERFFFGEEDFEFAHRMRRAGEKMVIIPESVIYHKVSASSKNATGRFKLGRDYLYYLGRLIVVREYSSGMSFALVRLLSFHRCLKYFMRDGLDHSQACRVVRRLMSDARSKEGIDYDAFKSIAVDGSFFDKI